jgi:hypothetical protein
MLSEAELLDTGSIRSDYGIVFDRYQGGSDKCVVSKLPKGYEVKAEAFKREEGVMLIGGFHYTSDYAVVSLLNPKDNRRIRATLGVGNFEKLLPSTKEPLPHLGPGHTFVPPSN